MKIMVAYDGTLHAKDALRSGIQKAKGRSAELLLLNIGNSNMFIDYDAGPRALEVAEMESARYLKEAKDMLKQEGNNVRVRIFNGEGGPEEQIIELAKTHNVDVLFFPAAYRSVERLYKKELEEQGRKHREISAFDAVDGLKVRTVEVTSL